MPWFMVDDKLHGHRKTARVSVEAMGLWVLAGSWCADNLEDGFVPDYVARKIDSKAARHASSLVAAGFWDVAERDGEKGWQFHDWDRFQPTRAQVEKKRADAAERMRRNREAKANGSRELRANEQRSSHAVTLTPAQPSPAQPIPAFTGGQVPEVGATSVSAKSRPPRNCKKHPEGTDDPCRACGNARKAHDDWRPPTLSAKTTMCGDHPNRKALNCPECAEVTGPPPRGWRASSEQTDAKEA